MRHFIHEEIRKERREGGGGSGKQSRSEEDGVTRAAQIRGEGNRDQFEHVQKIEGIDQISESEWDFSDSVYDQVELRNAQSFALPIIT